MRGLPGQASEKNGNTLKQIIGVRKKILRLFEHGYR